MQKFTRWILIGAVIVEAVVIMLLVTTQKRLVIVRSSAPALPPLNQLELAIDYESPDKKFEELVRQHPYLISARISIKGFAARTILADCAILERTNYVRILIENGADVEDAVKFLERIEAKDAINLLRQVQTESKSKTAP